MTLNLAVLHPKCIYVAADFALLDMRTRKPYIEPSMKVVQFNYWNGISGVVTYAGIGSVAYPGLGRPIEKSTAEIVVEWLTGLEVTSVGEVAETVREKGTKWLAQLTRSPALPPAHTFIVVGYESDGDSTLYLVSNHEAVNSSPLAQPEKALSTSQLPGRRSALITVTGQPQAVRRDERRMLARTVDAEPLNSGRIRTSMLGIVDKASTRAVGLVSANGAVFALLPGGTSSQTLGEPSDVDLHTVVNGRPMPTVRNLLQGLGVTGRQLVGGTAVFGSSAPIDQHSCGRSLNTVPESGYRFEEIYGIGDGRQTAIAIDQNGAVLGTSTDAEELGVVHFWLKSPGGETKVVPLELPSYQRAGGLDAQGNIYISRGGGNHGPARIVRVADGEGRDLESFEGLPCVMTSVSRTGWVAGSVEVLDDNTRADRVRAARWDPDGRLEIAPAHHPGFASTAVGIAPDGAAAVVYTDLVAPARAARWWPGGDLEDLEQLPGASVFPSGISSKGHVVGVRISAAGRLAVVAGAGGEWKPLGTPVGWEPGRVTAQGWVLGSVTAQGFVTPSVRFETGELASLPSFRYHSSSLMGTNDRGDIVGYVSGDYCTHAVVWRRDRALNG